MIWLRQGCIFHDFIASFFTVYLDFTKRRFIPYNPRYDLDLLIVPPPIPASDLLKGGHQFKGADQKLTHTHSPVPSPQENESQNEPRSTMYGKPSKEENPDKDEEVFTEPRSPLDDANNNNHHDDNNNNNNKTTNNNTWPHKPRVIVCCLKPGLRGSSCSD